MSTKAGNLPKNIFKIILNTNNHHQYPCSTQLFTQFDDASQIQIFIFFHIEVQTNL